MLVEIPDDFLALMKATAECEPQSVLVVDNAKKAYNKGLDNGTIYYARCVLDKLGMEYAGGPNEI